MHFTCAGGSAPAGSLPMHARQGTRSKLVVEAYSPYNTGYGDWRYPQSSAMAPENYGYGAGAFVGLVLTAILSSASNAYIAGIFLFVTILLTALTHYTARKTPAQTSSNNGWQQYGWQRRGRW